MTSDAELTSAADRPVAPHARTAVRTTAPRPSRRRRMLSVGAVLAVAGFGIAYLAPLGATVPRAVAADLPPVSLYAGTLADAQSYLGEVTAEVAMDRGAVGYTVYVTPTPTPTPTPERATAESAAVWTPPFVAPDPGSAQAIAYGMVQGRGWGDGEFSCLVALWNRESGWRVNAYNAGSGAYGIPQSLPGNKMASAGADWETNPATQIAWGLGYISGRYGSPCGAWGHSQSVGWY